MSSYGPGKEGFSKGDKVVTSPVKALRITAYYLCVFLLTVVHLVSWFFGFSFDWELEEREIWKW